MKCTQLCHILSALRPEYSDRGLIRIQKYSQTRRPGFISHFECSAGFRPKLNAAFFSLFQSLADIFPGNPDSEQLDGTDGPHRGENNQPGVFPHGHEPREQRFLLADIARQAQAGKQAVFFMQRFDEFPCAVFRPVVQKNDFAVFANEPPGS